jgi:hypothetical protein
MVKMRNAVAEAWDATGQDYLRELQRSMNPSLPGSNRW